MPARNSLTIKDIYITDINQFIMKYILTIILLSSMTLVLQAQTMKWIPMEAVVAKGQCNIDTDKKHQQICYALQYTPAASGTLTSYTTGFFVSCTSMGSAVVKNQSCYMTNNVNVVNGCDGTGMILMNSSGNSGTITNSKVQAGVPVIIHQVCFSIPYGESITIKEDPITDLTTSIDISPGVYKTEYPVCEVITIRRDKYDEARPLWLDFKVTSAGDLISQLDWTTTEEKDNSHFVIERSKDGINFSPVGTVESVNRPGHVNIYQFMDKQAMEGNNYYRLQQVSNSGEPKFSPIRMVNFAHDKFAVHFTPNPADEYLLIEIQSPSSESNIQLIDHSGRVIADEKTKNFTRQVRLDVNAIVPGIYSLVVHSGDNKFTEEVIIAH
jgi:hypothetical protein